jgi:hypothetical protein
VRGLGYLYDTEELTKQKGLMDELEVGQCAMVWEGRGCGRQGVLERACFYLQAIIFYYGEEAQKMP